MDLLFASEPLVAESRGASGPAGQYHPASPCGRLGLGLRCDTNCLFHYQTQTHSHTHKLDKSKPDEMLTQLQRYFHLDVKLTTGLTDTNL